LRWPAFFLVREQSPLFSPLILRILGTVAIPPVSDHDWTVHSINIHGVFFERWCQKVVAETPGWSLDSTNYPVEFPSPNGPLRGKESTLDIRASRMAGPDQRLCLLIECKKNNPEFVNWVFFHRFRTPRDAFHASQVENKPLESPATGWVTSSVVRNIGVPGDVVADEAREAKGDYSHLKSGDKTKTSNRAIQDAAYQVALATQAIIEEDSSISRRLGMRTGATAPPWRIKAYIPAIVTTAKLFVCDFDPANVDPITGEVPFDKATMSEVSSVVFEYTLPRHLQFGPADMSRSYGEGLVDLFTRMHLFVIQSQHFAEILKGLGGDADLAVGAGTTP
ncbi:MAG TPA: hypothetical protein VF944_09985, partial [Candidatus Bathyarchaeia archaeon]